jgi:hypothetical protein
MDQLIQLVKDCLDGLAIPPLQNIIIRFLPDRALLGSHHLIGIASTNRGKINIKPSSVPFNGGRVWLEDLRGGGAGADFAPRTKFGRFTLDFTSFLPSIEADWESGYYSALIIYHGQPEIIQIERRKQEDGWFVKSIRDTKPDKVWTNYSIQSTKPLTGY